ncbi:MAG: hypothetical protein OIN89_00365 [Candidatus Methanoperedens sp.]|jgi:hypothetical protein|nr:hypothetical protein [Candidatus Methanoperedens sp.]PKL54695.1 MAG: hypothetical protein CVV36_00360 [Candidatus Methanoperedenaceae archaeon HGW-Methanoperedenaceae-1]
MACGLGPEGLCTAVNNLRIAEDAVAAMIIAAVILLMLHLAYSTIRQGPFFKRLVVLALTFAPFLLWKTFGAYRRVFLDKTSAWNAPLEGFGEVMEAVTALFILGALIYMYQMIKPKELPE